MTHNFHPDTLNYIQEARIFASELPYSEKYLFPTTRDEFVILLEKLSPSYRRVLVQFYQFNKRLLDPESGWEAIFPSLQTIAKGAQVSVRTVQRFLRDHFNLQPYEERVGYKGQSSHTYQPMPSPLFRLFKEVESLGICKAIRQGTKAFNKLLRKLKDCYYKHGCWKKVINIWTSCKSRKHKRLSPVINKYENDLSPPPTPICHPINYSYEIPFKEYFCSTLKVPDKVFNYIERKLREGKEAINYLRNHGDIIESEAGFLISKIQAPPIKKQISRAQWKRKNPHRIR